MLMTYDKDTVKFWIGALRLKADLLRIQGFTEVQILSKFDNDLASWKEHAPEWENKDGHQSVLNLIEAYEGYTLPNLRVRAGCKK